jgi:pimeloyl-ACP methyl ester carboxylesterase
VAYSGTLESYHTIVARVRRRLEAASQSGQPYAAVAHSLGGLIARSALGDWPKRLPLPRHLVMLGTPNRPPRLAQRFHRWWPYRLVNGECGQLLAQPEFFADLPRPEVPITVIAGRRGWPGGFSLFGGDPNDGVVAVEETRLDLASALIELPASHTFMMNNRQVRAAVREVLALAKAS